MSIIVLFFKFLTFPYPSKQSNVRSTDDVNVVTGWLYPYSSFSIKVHRSKTLALSPKPLSVVFMTIYGVVVSISFTPSHYFLRLSEFHCLLINQISTVRTCRHTTFYMTCRLSTSRICSPLLNPPFAHLSSGQTMSL